MVGVVILAALVLLPFLYARTGYAPQGIFLLFGAAFGMIFQRSRFCLVRAFREPFLSGNAEHTRAAALAVIVCTLGFAILKRSEEHTSELQSHHDLVCRLLLEKKKK